MNTARRPLALFGTILFAAALQAAPKAHWLWYPGDFEIYIAQEVQETRLEWGGVTPVMWPQYHHYPVVTFRKTVELAEDETMTVEIDGKGMYVIEVTVKDGKATVRGCAAGFGTLRWNGRKATIPPNGTVTLN